MPTDTVPQKPNNVATLHLISSEVMFGHLPVPRALKFAPDGALTIDCDTPADHDAWCAFFAAEPVGAPMTLSGHVFVHAAAMWFGRPVWVDLFAPLAAAVALLPTDPGGHGCTPDCDCDTARQGRSLYANVLRRVGPPVCADFLLDTADQLLRDGHVRLDLDAFAGHGDDEVTGGELPAGVVGFAVDPQRLADVLLGESAGAEES